MSKGKVLIIGSNATQIEVRGGMGATGQYLNETVVPAMALVAAGYEIVLATPTGAKPYIDPASDDAGHFGGDQGAYERGKAFYETDPAMNQPRTLRSVIGEGLDHFVGVFVPGGQAPGVDLMQDAETGVILRHFHDRGQPTALLCHGPIAIASTIDDAAGFRAALIADDTAKAAQLAKGWPYAGYNITIFSNSEEKVVEEHILHDKLFFNVADALEIAGGKVITNPVNFEPNVIEDRELITGQNPRSDHPLAATLVAALDRSLAAA